MKEWTIIKKLDPDQFDSIHFNEQFAYVCVKNLMTILRYYKFQNQVIEVWKKYNAGLLIKQTSSVLNPQNHLFCKLIYRRIFYQEKNKKQKKKEKFFNGGNDEGFLIHNPINERLGQIEILIATMHQLPRLLREIRKQSEKLINKHIFTAAQDRIRD